MTPPLPAGLVTSVSARPPQPLYTELSLIVHQAQTDRPSSAPSRTSASLERYSTGALGGCAPVHGVAYECTATCHAAPMAHNAAWSGPLRA